MVEPAAAPAHPGAMTEPMIAVVTGASRGVGKGVALALGDAGATVYLTGRTLESREGGLPGSLQQTAAEVEARGGTAIPVACDHADDAQVKAVFDRVRETHGYLDVLVNNVFALPGGDLFGPPFWEQPIEVWDTMHAVGLRSHYVAAVYAAPLLLESDVALVANISSFGGASYQINVAYGVGKAGVDRLAEDMAKDFADHGVTSVSLYPGIVRTERILAMGDDLPWSLAISESPELTGRAVCALAADEHRRSKSGRVLVVADLAFEYGFTDVDGTTPPSLPALTAARRAEQDDERERRKRDKKRKKGKGAKEKDEKKASKDDRRKTKKEKKAKKRQKRSEK